MKRQYEYMSSESDAENILTSIMKRTRFGYAVRDELAEALTRIVYREIDRKKKIEKKRLEAAE